VYDIGEKWTSERYSPVCISFADNVKGNLIQILKRNFIFSYPVEAGKKKIVARKYFQFGYIKIEI
jgi:hypothetical protein